MNRRPLISFVVTIVCVAAACNSATISTVNPTVDPIPLASPTARLTPSPAVTDTAFPTPAPTPATTPASVPLLEDGPLAPGTYAFVHQNLCDDPPVDCPVDASPPPALGIEVTVPSDRWAGATELLTIWPRDGGSEAGALVMGWTNFWVGLNSEPCSQISHQRTDIEVGPSVDEFVDAVMEHPKLDTTTPSDVTLGGYSGRFFSLTAPADLSGCTEWRPWEPGFFAQGPENIWDVWVVDVNGFRFLVVAQYFAYTSPDIKAELRAMAESIRFVPLSSGSVRERLRATG